MNTDKHGFRINTKSQSHKGAETDADWESQMKTYEHGFGANTKIQRHEVTNSQGLGQIADRRSEIVDFKGSGDVHWVD